jgi:hypothetical protein
MNSKVYKIIISVICSITFLGIWAFLYINYPFGCNNGVACFSSFTYFFGFIILEIGLLVSVLLIDDI